MTSLSKHWVFAASLLSLTVLSVQLSTVWSQGTAFTYQGGLKNNGILANGSYDLTFTLYTNSTTGPVIDGPVTNSAVAVTNGLFTTIVDFGPGVFTGSGNWLEIAVSTNGANGFTTLAPRQQLTPTPYAMYAPNAGSVAGSNIVGAITTEKLPASVVTNGESSVNLSGMFAGNGARLTNMNNNPLTSPTRIVTEGDSNSDTYDFVVNFRWPAIFATLPYYSAMQNINVAVSGWGINNVTNDYATNVVNLKPTGGTNVVLIVMIGVNDSEIPWPTWVCTYSNYVARATNDGFLVCGVTIMPSYRDDTFPSALTNRLAENNFIRSCGMLTWMYDAAAQFINPYDTNTFFQGTNLLTNPTGVGALHLNTNGATLFAIGVDRTIRQSIPDRSYKPIMQDGTNTVIYDINGEPLATFNLSGAACNIQGNQLSGTFLNTANGSGVGIGIVSPFGLLQIQGGGSAFSGDASVLISQPSINRWHFTEPEGSLQINIGDVGGDYISILNGGNMGIGLTNPAAKLEVKGSVLFDTNLNVNCTITSNGYICPSNSAPANPGEGKMVFWNSNNAAMFSIKTKDGVLTTNYLFGL